MFVKYNTVAYVRCERCLINRYGLVLESMDPSSWKCPFCKKNCNCSVCRKKVSCVDQSWAGLGLGWG